MAGPTPYILLPGTTREALDFYSRVFGGRTELHTFAEFGRVDGPAQAIAHGRLFDGPVSLYAADSDDPGLSMQCTGIMLALLGTAPPRTLREWFARLSDGGRVIDDLRARPWGASDGQVIDRYGVHWLVGFQGDPDC